MQDRYLFRAKRIDNGEFVIGNYQRRFDLLGNEEHYIFCSKSHNAWEYAEVDPSTICQCTGLEDKNGVLIWENDICGRKEKNAEIVTYNNGDWTLDYSYAFKRKRGTDYCNLGFYANVRKCVEVIGNIFDNPELMEQEG